MVDHLMDLVQVVEFEMEDVAASMERAMLSLLGKLFTENPPRLTTIQRIFKGMWNCKVMVLEAKQGLLQFLFEDAKAMDWVVQQTPWPVKERVLQLQPGEEADDLEKRSYELG
ncbi:unnamed protein product [Linum trigynum]|uniref:DUF4283 domain-containing protein n=1 Tax=Linum trigynum TaxID=586398 RepID=A0AAV2DVM1_9ROSI